MHIDYDIQDGKITRLLIEDSEGIDGTKLRAIQFKELIRNKKKIGFIKPSEKFYLYRAAQFIYDNLDQPEVEVLVNKMNINKKTAYNYICEIKKEGILQWIS